MAQQRQSAYAAITKCSKNPGEYCRYHHQIHRPLARRSDTAGYQPGFGVEKGVGTPAAVANRQHLRRTQEFRDTYTAWDAGSFNSRDRIGGVMDIFKEHQPKNIEEAVATYFAHAHPWTEVRPLIKNFSAKTGISYTRALNYWLIRVIDETWEGYESELMGKALTLSVGMAQGWWDTVEFSDSETDTKYAVDLIARKNGVIVEGFQIKPPSYMFSKRIEHVKKANREMNARWGYKVSYLNSKDIRDGFFKRIDPANA